MEVSGGRRRTLKKNEVGFGESECKNQEFKLKVKQYMKLHEVTSV